MLRRREENIESRFAVNSTSKTVLQTNRETSSENPRATVESFQLRLYPNRLGVRLLLQHVWQTGFRCRDRHRPAASKCGEEKSFYPILWGSQWQAPVPALETTTFSSLSAFTVCSAKIIHPLDDEAQMPAGRRCTGILHRFNSCGHLSEERQVLSIQVGVLSSVPSHGCIQGLSSVKLSLSVF
jgi:hypothetical protein